jgi:UDP-GlcNAc3NAcA epimerase
MKIVTVVGTRPQFIKMLTLSKEFIKNNIQEIIVHSGQHFDKNMSEYFLKEVPKPKYHIDISYISKNHTLGFMINEISDILIKEEPKYVIVYGDCDTTLAGALAANKLDIKIIHIESGLRSYNKCMPEEVNRVLVDHISDILFCPNQNSINNLKREGINKNVYCVGDLMIELLRNKLELINKNDKLLDMYNIEKNNYYLLTIHRKNNTNVDKLNYIFSELEKLDKTIIYPMHPRIKQYLQKLIVPNNIKIIDPVNHIDMITLLKFSLKLITDSGGLQKEAYELKIPCITLREETEWIETIDEGKNILVTNNIYESIINFNPNNNYSLLYQYNTTDNIIKIINHLS